MTTKPIEHWSLYLSLLLLALLTCQNLLVAALGLLALPLKYIGVAMFVAMFSLIPSAYTLGSRRTLVFLGVTIVVSWGV